MSMPVPRILFISSEFPPGPGGIGNHAYHLVDELRKRRCELRVITPQEFATTAEIASFNRAQPFPVQTIPLQRSSLSKGVFWLRKAIAVDKSFRPDLIIASGARAVWVAAVSTQKRKTPLLAVGHGSEFGGQLTPERRLTRWAFNQAAAVVYVSHYTQQVARNLGIHPRRELVIHNGADASLFSQTSPEAKQKWAQSLGFSPTDPILLTVGNLTRRKGQEVVIRALPGLLTDFSTLRYLMAGLPTEKTMLASLAGELGISDHVHFLGNVARAELPVLYQACDLFVMTSQRLSDGDFEGFGISVIEAALCGKPAVVSGDSGLAEAVIDGVTGICVPEKDPGQTAIAIKKLLSEPETLLMMGKNAQERAQAELTWEKVGAEYYNLVNSLISNSRI